MGITSSTNTKENKKIEIIPREICDTRLIDMFDVSSIAVFGESISEYCGKNSNCWFILENDAHLEFSLPGVDSISLQSQRRGEQYHFNAKIGKTVFGSDGNDTEILEEALIQLFKYLQILERNGSLEESPKLDHFSLLWKQIS